MALESNVRTRSVSDPLALRALAHPIRLRLHSLVAREGTLTAADAAKHLDISHALASHHLRQLAKYGFVEHAEAPDGRAHPWRVTATSMRFARSDPDAQSATDALDRHAAQSALEQLADWQQRRPAEDADWSDLAGAGNSLLYLSPAELGELLEAWRELVMTRALERPIGHADQRPPGSAPVSLTLVVAPLRPTDHGG